MIIINNKDQDKYPRFVLHEYVSVKNADGQTLGFGSTSNISEEGICILINLQLQKDEVYKLIFHLSYSKKSTPITVMATVIHQYNDNSYGFVTDFKFYGHQNLDKIKSWISKIE